jgi:hypothetical protein
MSSYQFELTCQHAASSMGIPVLVDQQTGAAYGPHDVLPWGEQAAAFVLRIWGGDDAEVKRFLAAGPPLGGFR